METPNVLNNTHLTPDVSKDVRDLIVSYELYVNGHPELNILKSSVEKIKQKVVNLKIKQGSKYYVDGHVKLVESENTLYIGDLGENDDLQYLVLKELISSTFAKGLNKEAIDAGYASIITNNVVGNAGDEICFDEEVTVNLLSKIVGFDALTSYVTEGKSDMRVSLNNMGVSKDEYTDLMEEISYNYQIRKKLKFSNLYEIQKLLIDIYLKKDNLTKNDLKSFEIMLCSDSKYMSDACYKKLDTVREHFDNSVKTLNLENSMTR